MKYHCCIDKMLFSVNSKFGILNRADPQVIMTIERCILQGHPLLLENCDEKIDSLLIPIIQHQNTRTEEDQNTDEGIGRKFWKHIC